MQEFFGVVVWAAASGAEQPRSLARQKIHGESFTDEDANVILRCAVRAVDDKTR
jgi:hypothetical protein